MSMHQKKVITGVMFVVVYLFVLYSQRNVTRLTDSRINDIIPSQSHKVLSGIDPNNLKSLYSRQQRQPIVPTTDAAIRDQDGRPELASKHSLDSVTSHPNNSTCTPVTDVVFIKTHKTASSTLQNIFYRFGDERDLTFMLPLNVAHIQGITTFEASSVMAPPNGKHYNIIANHVRFFYEDFTKIMPTNTQFVTVIRETASHFSSMYSYYKMKKYYNVELEEFSMTPKFYFEKYDLNNEKRRHSGRDSLLFDLGFDKKDMYDVRKVDEYIKFLDKTMNLVLLTEYFLESLILLKDLMCWDMQTIVHHNSKMRVPLKGKGAITSDTNSTRADDALTKRLNAWNAGDFKLYDHFNRTLWQKVDAYGRDRMESEIAELKELCSRYESECMRETRRLNDKMRSRGIGRKEYVLRKGKAENVTCKRLHMTAFEYLGYLRDKHTMQSL